MSLLPVTEPSQVCSPLQTAAWRLLGFSNVYVSSVLYNSEQASSLLQLTSINYRDLRKVKPAQVPVSILTWKIGNNS